MSSTQFGAISLNGSSQYASAPHTADHNVGKADPLVIDISFKGSGTGPLVRKHDGSNGWIIEITGAGAVKATLNATTIEAGAGVDDSAWHQVRLAVIWRTQRAYLFVDGESGSPTGISALASMDSTATLYVGHDGSSAYYGGALSEFRISKDATLLGPDRSTTSYNVPVRQLVDDAYTLGLWHFNEGVGGTFYDMSDKLHQLNGSEVLPWVDGVTESNPLTITREHLLLALREDTAVTSFLTTNRNGKIYSMRPGEPTPETFTIENTPALILFPGGTGQMDPETFGDIYRVIAPIRLMGVMFHVDPSELEYLWFFTFRAILNRWVQTAGHLNHSHLQNWGTETPAMEIEEREGSNYEGNFAVGMWFEIRVPRRTL